VIAIINLYVCTVLIRFVIVIIPKSIATINSMNISLSIVSPGGGGGGAGGGTICIKAIFLIYYK
jgi:hypothetical protein